MQFLALLSYRKITKMLTSIVCHSITYCFIQSPGEYIQLIRISCSTMVYVCILLAFCSFHRAFASLRRPPSRSRLLFASPRPPTPPLVRWLRPLYREPPITCYTQSMLTLVNSFVWNLFHVYRVFRETSAHNSEYVAYGRTSLTSLSRLNNFRQFFHWHLY